ncbi:sugar ABC transporter substrate-binding protein [Salinibacterium sp.]|uniref:sugar ABC transporter substrate-binding protein n=1 Tax=Salinibacterium sp. TaxID=1915057 RepID=UPI00286C602A|nr:sugar ABC transporter substrate-binding protein [Salinibacterium sp.]
MKKRAVVSLVAGLALVAGVAGCSPATEDASESGQLNIWYVNPLTSYPAWAASMQKFEDEAKDGGYIATGVGPTKLDTAANVSQIEQAIADGADGIIFCNTDPTSFASTIKKAQDAGVVMVTIGCIDEVSDYSVGTDNDAFGATAADTIAADVGADASVLIISTDQTTPNQLAQVTAFKAAIASKHPEMKVAAWESDNSDTAVAAQKITASLQADPSISAIWCVEGQCPGGVPTGLGEAGKKPGDVYVLGIDTVDTTTAALKDGWLGATLNQCWFDATKLATDLIKAKVNGTPSTQQSWGIGVDPVTAAKLPYKGCPASLIPSL